MNSPNTHQTLSDSFLKPVLKRFIKAGVSNVRFAYEQDGGFGAGHCTIEFFNSNTETIVVPFDIGDVTFRDIYTID